MADWLHFDSGPGDPAWNMALDEALLLSSANSGAPVLRFYGWTRPAATFGYFQHHAEVAAWTPLRPLIRRTTGGGLVPHDGDWTYSLVIPPDHPWYELRASDSYCLLHRWMADSLRAIGLEAVLSPRRLEAAPGQCFVGAESADVLLRGEKIAGAAQRRAREGLLIQGSLQNLPPGLDRAAWQSALLRQKPGSFTPIWRPFHPGDHILSLAATLAETKYSLASHNERR